MSAEIDRLAAARPGPVETSDLVGPEERQALLDRIVRTERGAAAAAPRRRRPAVLLALPTAAAGVAVVVAMAVAAGPHRSGDGGGAPAAGPVTESAAPAEQTVSYVLARARTALGDTRELVQHTVIRSFRGCSTEMWTYLGGAAGSARDRYMETCGGAPSQDIATRMLPGQPGRAHVTYVKHFERTWSGGVTEIGADPALAFGAESSPEQLRQQLADGTWKLAGRERIGGRDTLHLRAVGLPGGGPQPQIWVDASSFLVVRTLVVKGGPGEWVPLQKDFDWQRATPATMADFDVRVPPGYRRTG